MSLELSGGRYSQRLRIMHEGLAVQPEMNSFSAAYPRGIKTAEHFLPCQMTQQCSG